MLDKMICCFMNLLCCAFFRREYLKFSDVKNPLDVQKRILKEILTKNKTTEYGIRYRFQDIRTIDDFQKNLPVSTYDDYQDDIKRMADGEENLLTTDNILLYELTSGSTNGTKLIPYTQGLKAEFQNGIKPWIYDMYLSNKILLFGKSYWSITPAASKREYTSGGRPIGFEEDSEYFGKIEKIFVESVFAVKSDVSKSDTIDGFYFKTALSLLNCSNLRIISVWSPSFLLLILEYIDENKELLIEKLHKKRKMKIAERIKNKEYTKIWEKLSVISCWCDAGAKIYADKLRVIFAGVKIIPKGVLSTECFISFPFSKAGGAVLSVHSHFFEFRDMETNCILTVENLEKGHRYEVIVTTSGGFYRYNMKDVIQVNDFYNHLPVMTFVGRSGNISDLFGEKVEELFVSQIREMLNADFFMIAPQKSRYVLYIKADKIKIDVENEMRKNFHYDYCRKLGQLDKLAIFRLTGNPESEYIERLRAEGIKIGDIKLNALSLKDDWDQYFTGHYDYESIDMD